jgi:hypothetical protein
MTNFDDWMAEQIAKETPEEHALRELFEALLRERLEREEGACPPSTETPT